MAYWPSKQHCDTIDSQKSVKVLFLLSIESKGIKEH